MKCFNRLLTFALLHLFIQANASSNSTALKWELGLVKKQWMTLCLNGFRPLFPGAVPAGYCQGGKIPTFILCRALERLPMDGRMSITPIVTSFKKPELSAGERLAFTLQRDRLSI